LQNKNEEELFLAPLSPKKRFIFILRKKVNPNTLSVSPSYALQLSSRKVKDG
jgi:hypothetical protein